MSFYIKMQSLYVPEMSCTMENGLGIWFDGMLKAVFDFCVAEIG